MREFLDLLRIEVKSDGSAILLPLRLAVGSSVSAVHLQTRFIMIHSSEKRPENATVRIRFRDRWFYIDATDTRSKRAFGLLRTFIGMRLADPATAHQAPGLTVPVN